MGKLVSVIMGVYNCAETLTESLNSIVNQTYKNWEIIICDDGSQDNTIDIVTAYVIRFPTQITLLKNERNMGLNYTLNKCLKFAKGEYIARMDGDDRCSPYRFEKEMAILDKNSDIAIVSTDMEFFDENGLWGRTHVKKYPVGTDFLSSTPFCHAACMVRKEAYNAVNGYSVSDKLLRVEDYHLWIKMYEKGYKGCNIQEPLYQMRDDCNAKKRRKFKYRINECYIKCLAIKHLKLPMYGYIHCVKPIILGFMPDSVYDALHHKKQQGVN
ncbi:glycosyltransferase [Enterocloster bolteae]|uniref:glycosyltransferase n=1 Tax=Enterocloster bolteae TaxID=208479 RepID=UPI00189C9349|nr:glycosyltransferase [Enterocloster bolteae]